MSLIEAWGAALASAVAPGLRLAVTPVTGPTHGVTPVTCDAGHSPPCDAGHL